MEQDQELKRYYTSRAGHYARALRRGMTAEERHLWFDFLRSYQPKFYRQRPLGRYIADFVCPTAQLCIELDGGQHYEKQEEKYDEKRSVYLQERGYRVLRFSNSDIWRYFKEVCEYIDKAVHDVRIQGRMES